MKDFFIAAQFVRPADLVGVSARDLVEGADGVVWPKNAHAKALARKTIEFAQDLDFELRAQRRQALQTAAQTFKRSNFQTFKFSNFQVFKLSNFQTFKCSHFQTFKLSNAHMFMFFKLSNVQTFKFSNVQTFKLSNVSNFQTFKLS